MKVNGQSNGHEVNVHYPVNGCVTVTMQVGMMDF